MPDAADLFESLPFELRHGENFFGEDFVVVFAGASMERYADLVEQFARRDQWVPPMQIGRILDEIVPFYVRYVVFGVSSEDGVAPVGGSKLEVAKRAVGEAIIDARQQINHRALASIVDRAHAAFHGYLRALCEDGGVEVDENADVPKLYQALRDRHPGFKASSARAGDIAQAVRALSSVIDVLNPVKNSASLADSNGDSLRTAEVRLLLDCTYTLFRYLDSELSP